MKALFNGTEFFNAVFNGSPVEHIRLNGSPVWSRPNLFFAASATTIPSGRLKNGDIVVVDAAKQGKYQRAVAVESEAELMSGGLTDGYYLILGE